MLVPLYGGGRSLKALGGIPPYSIGVEYEVITAHVVRSAFSSPFREERAR